MFGTGAYIHLRSHGLAAFYTFLKQNHLKNKKARLILSGLFYQSNALDKLKLHFSHKHVTRVHLNVE